MFSLKSRKKVRQKRKTVSNDVRSHTQAQLRLEGVDYVNDLTIKNHIFICGLHRSGTTLLEQYIHAHFDVTGLRADVRENEGQFLQDVYAPAHQYGGPGKFAFRQKMLDDLYAIDDFEAARTNIMAGWSNYMVGGSETLLEKSPPNIIKIGWLRQVFPGARFLIFLRDPRAVSGATLKWAKTSLEELMMHWSVAHSVALRDMGPDCTVIRYEDFCENPDQSIEASGIAEFLTRRQTRGEIEGRFENLKNVNGKYLEMHDCQSYGRGAWDEFGYSL